MAATRTPRMAKVNLSESLAEPISDEQLEKKPEEASSWQKGVLAMDKSGEQGAPLEEHELAHSFPPMSDDEYDSLKLDIYKNGQLVPIYTYNNQIIDGRHRYRVMRELGLEPIVEEFAGESPLNFVVAMNLNRRHLTPAQRAIIALDLMPKAREEAQRRMQAGRATETDSETEVFKGTARDAVGEMLQISGRVIANAEKIKEAAPDLVAQIASGGMSINQALKEAKERPDNPDGTPRTPVASRERAKPRAEERVDSAIGELIDNFDMWLKEYGRLTLLKPLSVQVRDWRKIAVAAKEAGLDSDVNVMEYDVNDYELEEDEEPADEELVAIDSEDD